MQPFFMSSVIRYLLLTFYQATVAAAEANITPVVDSPMVEVEETTTASKAAEEAAGNRPFAPDLCMP